MAKQKSNASFVTELSIVNPDVQPLSTYVKASQHILCRCKRCSFEWSITPNNLLRGYGCPKCGIKKRAKSRTKCTSTFVAELREISPNIKVLSTYNGAREHILVECQNCKNQWEATPTNLLKGRGCPKCANAIRADKLKRPHEDFINLLSKLHPDIVTDCQYEGNQKPLQFKCNKCNFKWHTSPASLLSGHGCPRCAKNAKYTQEEFIAKIQTINPQIEVLGTYIKSHVPILCRCKLCNFEWNVRPNNLLSGTGCPKCFHSTTSFLEEAIYESFRIAAKDIEILSRDRTAIGSELDIYIPELCFAIEPGSWKWHSKQLNKDKLKREKCADKGIRLITIYTDYPAIAPPFTTDCLVYKETIGYEQDSDVLKQIIVRLLHLCDLSYKFTDDEWTDIIQVAYRNSRRRTTSEFCMLVTELHPQIEVLGEYTGSWNKIHVKCRVCKKEWDPQANSLLQGHGCPTCAAIIRGQKNRKSAEQFLYELSKVNSNIEILTTYEASYSHVQCKCSICGNTWEALPNNLLRGRGCPQCAHLKCSQEKRMPHHIFVNRMQHIHPQIEVLSSYYNSSEKITCKCKNCDTTWSARPAGLLSGRGCPECAIAKRNQSKQKKVVLVESGQLFDSIKAAAEFIGTSPSNISACLRKKTQTAKGVHWKFFDAPEE